MVLLILILSFILESPHCIVSSTKDPDLREENKTFSLEFLESRGNIIPLKNITPPSVLHFENLEKSPDEVKKEEHFEQTENITVAAPLASALFGQSPPVKKRPQLPGCSEFCAAGHHAIGICLPSVECYRRGGSASNPCCGGFHVCCQFINQCGETSREEIVHFQSPDYPLHHRGSLACDFEILISQDVCAVRIDFADVSLYPRYGGICDVDQILIMNSVDGSTSAQCGDLSHYSATVAVHPGQSSPLKIVMLIQNEGSYRWDIRLRQIRCSNLHHYRKPTVCGAKRSSDPVSFYNLIDLWRNTAWYSSNQNLNDVWWRPPGPSFNRFYYGSTKKALKHDVAEDRIITGTDADLHEFPWQVALFTKQEFFCGGVLINDEYVLSAAHCFLTQDTAVANLIVYLGEHDLTSFNETISEIRGVREVHYHAHFHPLLLSNDIALIRLDRPVSFSQRIRPVCLPDNEVSVLGKTGVVSGWGVTSYPDAAPSPILQKLHVQVMENSFCEASLNENLGPGNLCAVSLNHGGTCLGDSGGPLTVMNDHKDTLIGIVSFGITGCASAPGMPDLYTRVSAYLNWIDISTLKHVD